MSRGERKQRAKDSHLSHRGKQEWTSVNQRLARGRVCENRPQGKTKDVERDAQSRHVVGNPQVAHRVLKSACVYRAAKRHRPRS